MNTKLYLHLLHLLSIYENHCYYVPNVEPPICKISSQNMKLMISNYLCNSVNEQ